MSDQEETVKYAKRNFLVQVVIAVIMFAAIVFGGNYIYNEFWQRKYLVYTILPAYDLGEQVFSGLVVENQGNVGLTEIELIISDLEYPIVALNMPGPHETAEIAEGGEGEKDLVVKMPRLSEETSLAIYILTEGYVTLEPKRTLQATSKEVRGISSVEREAIATRTSSIALLVFYLIMVIALIILLRYVNVKYQGAEFIVRTRRS
jgi:hypothetical protein